MTHRLLPLFCIFIAAPAYAVPTEAPGFRGTSELPLVSARTEIDVSGVVLRGTVRQTFVNRSSTPIEARYVFPGSTGAAIDGLEMQIGDRRIVAKIGKRGEARATYEAAKASGRSASLLEQHRPNVFETSVANIMPGDRIEVTVTYTELLVPEERVYEIVLPQVVAERFDAEAWQAFAAGKTPSSRVEVRVDAGMQIQEMTVPTHHVAPWIQGRVGTVTIDAPQGFDRDVVVRYRLAGNHVQTGIVLDEHEDGGSFVFMMQPPARVAPNAIPPREYVFIVDVSGSMDGYPLEVAREVLTSLAAGMGPMDRFNVLCFASSSRWLAEAPVEVNRDNVEAARRLMTEHSHGGTQLSEALERALAAPRHEGVSTSFIVITDGFITAEAKSFELIRDHRGEANVFAFGIGDRVNRHLVEGIATAGLGHPFIVSNATEAKAAAKRFSSYIASPVLTDIELTLEGFDAYDLEPKTVPDLFADRPVVVLGKYRGTPQGRIGVRGAGGGAPFVASIPIERTGEQHPAIVKLWARRRIAELTIMSGLTRDPRIGDEIEKLGLAHSLLTQRTSFVAVDPVKRAPASPQKIARRHAPIRETPELDPSAATGAVLFLFGVLALLERRRRV